jgi:hypothetical protein
MDVEVSTETWLPVLRIAGTIFLSTETLIRRMQASAVTAILRQLFYVNLFDVISLICTILSEDCPTSLQTMRFLEQLRKASDNLSHLLGMVGATEDTQTINADTLNLWREAIDRELQAVRSLLPEDTPVFSCPFPLAGCTYQTTNMQQWILHKDQCHERRSASRTSRHFESELGERLNSRYSRRGHEMIKFALLEAISKLEDVKNSAVPTCLVLPARARGIATLIVGGCVNYPHSHCSSSVGRWGSNSPPPQCDHWLLFEAIYRIVWLELLRLFGLCMLSVLPVCTNMLGFMVCWLSILRSVNMWKCKGKVLLSI